MSETKTTRPPSLPPHKKENNNIPLDPEFYIQWQYPSEIKVKYILRWRKTKRICHHQTCFLKNARGSLSGWKDMVSMENLGTLWMKKEQQK